jgi:hypothetical protein
MQKGMSREAAGRRNNPEAESNIERLLSGWRGAKATVIHVRHMSRTLGSPFWPGQTGAEFQEALRPLDSEHVVEKNIPDAFAQSALERWLRLRGLDSLVIVGVSTNNSVEATARASGFRPRSCLMRRLRSIGSITAARRAMLPPCTPCHWPTCKTSTRKSSRRTKHSICCRRRASR